ncbi:H(+)/Cl(-) exchange transporter ClcA [Methylocella silvestris]|uniref:H(+)/Cl(-) exchange transporter ClcA n=1 Tax=Methylocella silvestris TaxID=199596 RepID=A0A2J7THA9_METSI|nr:H(+)/Cl(-) exchange transporter ClcA [Methylocella silvestris]PNG26139.1 H(+)/Cl(-) exchange transporter ClcA [Methylocella silvestris]
MQTDSNRSGLTALAILSVLAGAGAGLVCGLFRLALDAAAGLRASFPQTWTGPSWSGCLILMAVAAAATATAALLVRRIAPTAIGSGIPHVEAVIAVEAPPAPFILLPVKFIGGVLAIGSGLALGREGPCVQMGATLAQLLGAVFRRDWPDRQTLLAAGAGAGLAAAFNAPLAGAAFVLEELLRRFDLRAAFAGLGASMSAIVVARLFTGAAPDFLLPELPLPDARDFALCLALGVVAGGLGSLYNHLVLEALDMSDAMVGLPIELRAGVAGAFIGALGWFAPSLVGGGDGMTQALLTGAPALALIPLAFLLRLFLSAASYAAGTPGGLFAPMLVLGAQIGYFFGAALHPFMAAGESHAALFAVVGMAAFFTAVVRAPLTGMILVTEMTGSSAALLPMLGACFTAMGFATLLGGKPLYDSLKERSAHPPEAEPEKK